MPKIIIDGKEIEFKPGQTVIEAAADNGIDIPHFCWHPKLSVSGNCRMCLVDIEKMPKLAIACSTLASDGMIIHSQNEKAIHARNAVMEFFLINHPLDCPICDEAGECKLQDDAYQHSVGESRFLEEKNHKDKRVPLGPNVMFDGERCISCSRCIRFCDEIAKDAELTFVQRGDQVTITTYPGEELDNPYAMNVVDICPVGALTNRDFRFKSRVWDMSSNKSICQGCARGCNIEIWVRNNQILRLTPRQNEKVNSFWMCDHGRLNTFKYVNAESRIDGPHLRREGVLTKVGWDESFAQCASRLKAFSKNEIAVIGSPYVTSEDSFIISKFVKSVLGTMHLDFLRHIDPAFGDDVLRQSDITPNSLGAELTGIAPSNQGLNFEGIINGINEGRIKALYLIEDDLVSADSSLENILAKLDLFVVNSSNFNRTTELADIVFPASTFAEKNGTIINYEGWVQRIKPAVTTVESDRSLDGLELSRLDKFGTQFDRWNKSLKYDARPTWKILLGLSAILGSKIKYNLAEDIFREMANIIPAFKGMDYDSFGDFGVPLKVDIKQKNKIAQAE